MTDGDFVNENESRARDVDETVGNLCEEVEAFIVEKPVKALLIAFLSGVVLSRILL